LTLLFLISKFFWYSNKGLSITVCYTSEPKKKTMKNIIGQFSFEEVLNVVYGVVGGYMVLAMMVLVSMM